ncbi:chemotaxis-specific protein-glutamate methyltransferase CheB [uncultured Jatrophihabitans sp.]|uniref:chemotaxis-specific protein-glutamate methyltransferase CheB n=1 Tax=uncultured Jatrophihabitans sp. TaxID=1610747 RepID=UPI0035CC3D6D
MTVRALVVDDSVVVRRAVATLLDAEDDIEVVATAANGQLGLDKIADQQPDIVTLDVEMPVLDGLGTLTEIRKRWPRLPVIMYSTLTERGAQSTLEALALGAVDYATKPTQVNRREEVSEHVRQNLLPLVRLWGRRAAPVPRDPAPGVADVGKTVAAGTSVLAAPGEPITLRRAAQKPADLIAVGVSTGGPDALARMVPMLPGDLGVPTVIVQHMPPVFTAMLAARLDARSPLTVSEAVDGETALPGHVYVAPGGRHLEVHRTGAGFVFELNDGPKENSCRPAVDPMFRTAAAATDGRLLAVVLTGMGQDGLLGAEAVIAAGGSVIAQDEATSVVWGMPGFVARAGLASQVLPLDDIAETVRRSVRNPLLRSSA